MLRYRGEGIALVSRGGQPLNRVDDLGAVLRIVDRASAVVEDGEPAPKPPSVDPPPGGGSNPPPSPGPADPRPAPPAGPGDGANSPALQLSPSGRGVELASGGNRPSSALIRLQASGRRSRMAKALQFGVHRPGGRKGEKGLLLPGGNSQVELRQGEELRFGRRRHGRIQWLAPQSVTGDRNSLTLRFGLNARQPLEVRLERIDMPEPGPAKAETGPGRSRASGWSRLFSAGLWGRRKPSR